MLVEKELARISNLLDPVCRISEVDLSLSVMVMEDVTTTQLHTHIGWLLLTRIKCLKNHSHKH